MTDLATLGLRIESHEVEVAEERLHGMATAADRAEAQTDQLAMAARRGQSAVSGMNAAMRQQQLVQRAAQTQMGLTAAEGLNLSRQFTDIGVSAALGMNPLLILIQQGPQIADVFQTASMRGVGFSAVLGQIGRSAGMLLLRLGPIAALAGAVGGGFALMARDMNQANDDVVAGLGLTKEQLERLEESGESTAITMGDAFRGFGTTVKEVLQEAFGPELEAAEQAWNRFLDGAADVTGRVTTFILERFLGAYYGIRAAWSGLPAALGDAAVQAANAAVRAIEWMLGRAVEGINALLPTLNLLRRGLPGGALLPEIGQLSAPSLGAMDNPNAGALSAWNEDIAAGRQHGIDLANSMADGFMERWRENTEDSREARLRAAAGDPAEARGRRGGMTDAEREAQRILRESERFLEGLRERTADIGLNEIERQMLAVARAAELAGRVSAELAAEITAAGEAWRERTEAFERDEQLRAIRESTQALADEAAILELERDLIGSTNEERERSLAMLRAEIELRRQADDLFQRTGIRQDLVNTPEGQAYIQAAGQNAIDAAALADMQALHDALASTFESAMRDAMRGDWRGVLETILTAILDRTLSRLANDMAGLFSQQQGQGGIGSLINAGLSFFGGGQSGAPGLGKMAAPSSPGLGNAMGKIVVEFRDGPAFGGKVLEVVGPVIAQTGVASAKGGANLALEMAQSYTRNKLGR